MNAQHSHDTYDAKYFPVTQSMSGFAAATVTEANRSFAPIARQTTQAGSEVAQLAARRMAAWSDHHKRLMACRQPTDVFAAVQTFWTRAFDDYTACNKALMATWTSGFASMMPTSQSPATPRDVLSIREPGTDRSVAETDPRRTDGRRDAA